MKRGFLGQSVSDKKKKVKDDSKEAIHASRASMTPDHLSHLSEDVIGAIPHSASMHIDSWSNLEQGISDLITKHLNLPDLVSFSQVSKHWNSLSAHLLSPLLIVSFRQDMITTPSTSERSLGFFSIFGGKVYKVGTPDILERDIRGSCPGGWLITVCEKAEIKIVRLFPRRVVDLPHARELPGVSCSLTEGGDIVYTVCKTPKDRKWTDSEFCEWYVHKVIMSSGPTSAIVMSLQGDPRRLAFCRPGKDNKWHPVGGNDDVECLVDVIFYQGKFYTLQKSGRVFVVEGLDGSSPSTTFVANPPCLPEENCCLPKDEYLVPDDFHYLVESSGELLLVWKKLKRSPRNSTFAVFKLDFDGSKWVDVYDLGKDCALFLGIHRSFSFTTSKYPRRKGNCIYFTGSFLFPKGEEAKLRDEVFVYSLSERKIEMCPHLREAAIKSTSDVWFSTNLS